MKGWDFDKNARHRARYALHKEHEKNWIDEQQQATEPPAKRQAISSKSPDILSSSSANTPDDNALIDSQLLAFGQVQLTDADAFKLQALTNIFGDTNAVSENRNTTNDS